MLSNKQFASYFTILFSVVLFCPPSVLKAQISGTVFRDYNANGVKDNSTTFNEPVVSGITVKAYNAAGIEVGSTTSNAAGTYAFTGLTLPLRIEFSGIATGDYTAAAGGSNLSSVQFYTVSSTTANFGVNYPSDYCQSNPTMVTPCYINGYGSTEDVLVGFPYNSSGNTVVPSNLYATAAQIGSTWGVAFQRSTQTIFASAFFKRHCGLGGLGIGGIYKVNSTSTTPTATNFVDVKTIGIDVGTVPDNITRGLPTVSTDPSHDPLAFPLAGKVGMGDMDITEDGNTLFLINLYDRKLYSIIIDSDNNAATPPTAADVHSYNIPSPNCNNGVSRPWALKVYKGKLYVGLVCTGENGGTTADLLASVYAMDISTGIFNNTPIVSIPLTYPKLDVEYGAGTNWMSWTDVSTNIPQYSGDASIRPQPILSGIEFDMDGSMILGFNDRTGHQFGARNYTDDVNDFSLYSAEIGGDILRLSNNNGVFTLENNGSVGGLTGSGVGNNGGPGTLIGSTYTAPFGEFYDDSAVSIHNDAVQGGIALLPGDGTVAGNFMDPIDYYSGGIVWWSNTTGSRDRAYQLYSGPTGSTNTTFGKANGLGDLELLCNGSPIEIGNRVWNDTNNNGIQDAGEAGIGNVAVELYPDFDNDGAPDVIPAGSACVSNTTATGANTACAGTVAWTNPTNAQTVDAVYATAALALNASTNCLQVTNLGLNIPANATITGVTATITRRASAATRILDNTVQLLVGGVATGTNLATATTYTTTLIDATYGSSSNTWGTTLSPTQVNAANFGINFRASRNASGTGSATVSVDAIQVSVCYTTPSGANSIATTTTATTGNIGTYYFNASNVADGDPSVAGNQAGLAPNKKYLIRVGSTDWAAGIGAGDLVGLELTTTNAVPVAGLTDASDNDGVLSSTIPTIAYTTGNYGENNHTLDFGFAAPPPCTVPTLTSVAADTATCTNGVANNDAKLTIRGITGMAKYSYGTNGTTGLFAANATASTADSIKIISLTNPTVAQTYTFRIFASDSTCYNDATITLPPSVCPVPCSVITLTPSTLPGGQVGQGYSTQVSATGGTAPYQFVWYAGSTGVLPAGLSMDVNGLVTGTPTSSGSYSVKIAVKDAHQCADTLDPAIISIQCTYPTIGSIVADTATCTNGVANNNAAILVTGIVNGVKYSYGTNGTTGFSATTATTLSGGTINLTGLPNPSVATTYTFRIYGSDASCYSDTTIILTPSVCQQPCPTRICIPVTVARNN